MCYADFLAVNERLVLTGVGPFDLQRGLVFARIMSAFFFIGLQVAFVFEIMGTTFFCCDYSFVFRHYFFSNANEGSWSYLRTFLAVESAKKFLSVAKRFVGSLS
jgi:hypothetical protein